MSVTLFQSLVLIGLFAIGVEVYQIRKQIKNLHRIVAPIIDDWYDQNPDAEIPTDE